MSRTIERRKHPRRKVIVQSRIAGAQGANECETIDLSANGLSCLTPRPLDIFTKVRITLMIPDRPGVNGSTPMKPVDCEGVVVRSDPDTLDGKEGYHTAIFFNHVQDEAIDLIQQYVSTHKH